MLIAVFRDLYPTDEFHHEIRTTGLSGAAIEYLRNAGMIHQSECLPFRLEPGDDTLSVHAWLDDFYRDTTPDRLLLFGHEDNAADTFTYLLQQFVTPNSLERLLLCRGRNSCLADRLVRRFLQEIAHFRVGREQGFHLSAQPSVSATGSVKKGRTLLDRNTKCFGENERLPLGRTIHFWTIKPSATVSGRQSINLPKT